MNFGRDWQVQLLAEGCLLYARMSGGVPGPRGIVAGSRGSRLLS